MYAVVTWPLSQGIFQFETLSSAYVNLSATCCLHADFVQCLYLVLLCQQTYAVLTATWHGTLLGFSAP